MAGDDVSMRAVALVRVLFGLAAAGLGLHLLAYGASSPAAHVLPAWMATRQMGILALALLLLAAGIGICFARTALPGALTLVVYLMIWTLSYLPQVIAAPLSFGGWYGFCEALTALGGAWMLYASERRQLPTSRPPKNAVSLQVARSLFGLTCIFYGASHFAFADYTATMVPGWLPWHRGFAYLTGLAHAAAGAALVLGTHARLAAALEASMMSLFGLLVWVPSFLTLPRPAWAGTPANQWSELVVNLVLAASAWVLAVLLPAWCAESSPPADSALSRR